MEGDQATWANGLTVPKLKEELKARGQPQGGLKAVLVDRLLAAMQQEAAEKVVDNKVSSSYSR